MGSSNSRKKSSIENTARNSNRSNKVENTKLKKNESYLTNNELAKLQKCFKDSSGGDRVLNFQEYLQLFIKLNPSLIGKDIVLLAEQAFILLDKNLDGLIDFQEFIGAYNLKQNETPIVYNRNFREVLTNYFNTNNAKNNEMPGYVSTDEAYFHLMLIYESFGTPVRFPSIPVVRHKFNTKPYIKYEDFINFIEPYYINPD